MIHEHECHYCETPLTCCCASPLQVDRMTGKPRVFECLACMELRANIVQDALTEAYQRVKGEAHER